MVGISRSIFWLFLILSSINVLICKLDISSLSKKRILSEVREIFRDKISIDIPFNTSDEIGIRLSPLKKNILEWHFSFTGVEGTFFDGGLYHGKIVLHPEYPQKAPIISLLTPNGRWEINKAICLSASAYHQESWDPNWNLRTLVMSIRNFMTTQPREIGGISSTPQDKVLLATRSRTWTCKGCGTNHARIYPLTDNINDNNHDNSNSNSNNNCVLNSSLIEIDRILEAIERESSTGGMRTAGTGTCTTGSTDTRRTRLLRLNKKVTTLSKKRNKTVSRIQVYKQKLFLTLMLSSLMILCLKFLNPLNRYFTDFILE